MADNPFGLIRHVAGEEPFFFKSRDDWFGGFNSACCSTAWAGFMAARVFEDEADFSRRLDVHSANQVHWILGMNPLNLCMLSAHDNPSPIPGAR